jgi:hypothetical protein
MRSKIAGFCGLILLAVLCAGPRVALGDVIPLHPGGPICPAAPYLDGPHPHLDVAPFSSGHSLGGVDPCASPEVWHVDDAIVLWPDDGTGTAPDKTGLPIFAVIVHGLYPDAAGVALPALVAIGNAGIFAACVDGGGEVGPFCRTLVNLTPYWAEWHTAVVEADAFILAEMVMDPPSVYTTIYQRPDGEFVVTQKPVPLPATALLVALGLLAMGSLRSRRDS